MQRSYRFLHLDVFTDRRFSGNQLAVLPDAAGLDPERMQAIAAEIAFSETAFLLPAETDAADYRLRIFTPRTELPIAGHPTIGTAFAMANDGIVVPGTDNVTLALGVGPTEIALEWTDGKLHFAWMEQPVAELGPQCPASADLAIGLGIESDAIGYGDLAPEVASSGVPLLLVPLRSRAAVDRVSIDLPALRRYFASCGIAELPVFAFSLAPGDDGATAYSRMFAPLFGIPEDPATGGASGPLGCYLVHHGAVTGADAERMVSMQGVAMGRPSRISIAISCAGDQITRVRVGGQAVLVAEGNFHSGLDPHAT